jgi:Putative amidoligase enzyme
MSSPDGRINPDSSTADSPGRQEVQGAQRTATRLTTQGTLGSPGVAQVTRSTTSSHAEGFQAPSTSSASRQTVHTRGDRESSRPRESRQRLSGTHGRLHLSPLRVPANPIPLASAGPHHAQRTTGGPGSTSQETGLQHSHAFRTTAMNRLVAGSAGPDTVRQARNRAISGARGETQDQTHNASVFQGHPAGLRGQWHTIGASQPQSAGLVPLMGSLTLGAEPSPSSSGEQQAPDSSSARPPNAPLAADPGLRNRSPARHTSVRPLRRQHLPQLIEELSRTPSVSPTPSAVYPINPPPPPPPPPTSPSCKRVQATGSSVRPPGMPGVGTVAGSSTSASYSGPRIINIGIETEFMLTAHRDDHAADTLEEFAKILAANHNLRVQGTQKRMRLDLRPTEYAGEYTEWCLVKEETIYREWSPCKLLPIPVSHDIADIVSSGGIELVTPVFRALPRSTWRRDVEATWRFLHQHYQITGGITCGTHIHVSFEAPGEYTTDDLRRIARCVIHFEPAVEALMPRYRRTTNYAKSNWLQGHLLGHCNKSRRESIAAIDGIPTEGDEDEIQGQIVNLMQGHGDRDYAWNFLNILWGKGTIEFRKPPACTSAAMALSWTELAMSFIQAAVRYGTPHRLERVPSTVGGLRWFLEQACRPGVNEPARLEAIWAGHAEHEAVQPQFDPTDYLGQEGRVIEARLRNLTMIDQARIQRFARSARKPYWD